MINLSSKTRLHHSENCQYPDAAIVVMIGACWETIPTTKPLYPSGMIMLKATLILRRFGIICGLKMIRLKMISLHHVCKMVLKRDAEIRCHKMAEAIVNNDNTSFWKQPKSCLPRKATYPEKFITFVHHNVETWFDTRWHVE